MEEEGIRVWSIDEELEKSLAGPEEPERKRQRLEREQVGTEDDDGEQPGVDREEQPEVSLELLGQKIKKPLAFQKKGSIVWQDSGGDGW